jgi:hypothetical protein
MATTKQALDVKDEVLDLQGDEPSVLVVDDYEIGRAHV